MRAPRFQVPGRAWRWMITGTPLGGNRNTQVGELFYLVTELWEKEGRLRNISESEKELDEWKHGLTF